jgi:hypothetical protein
MFMFMFVFVFVCMCMFMFVFVFVFIFICGPGSAVGITTDYGMDGPGSNSGGDGIFRSSRPALGPTQPPVELVPCSFPG